MVLVLKKETKASFFKSQRPSFNQSVHIYFVLSVALLKYNASLIVAFVHSLTVFSTTQRSVMIVVNQWIHKHPLFKILFRHSTMCYAKMGR